MIGGGGGGGTTTTTAPSSTGFAGSASNVAGTSDDLGRGGNASQGVRTALTNILQSRLASSGNNHDDGSGG